MCLAQGHNAVTPVRLKPAAPRSQVQHSTTEPMRHCAPISLRLCKVCDPCGRAYNLNKLGRGLLDDVTLCNQIPRF